MAQLLVAVGGSRVAHEDGVYTVPAYMQAGLEEGLQDLAFAASARPDGSLVLRPVAPEHEEQQAQEAPCRHVWECLRGRTHNRGSGKYQAYSCRECGAFQRR